MTLRRAINLAIGVVLFGIAVYRAKTQSFTIDEAHTYNEYIRLGWDEIFNGYFDANNHILYTVLARLSMLTFGLSEFTLRLPALAAAALFLWSLARLTAQLVPSTPFSVLTFLVVAANPVTLDFMAAARGYGPSLALFTCAFSELAAWLDDGRDRRIPLASFLLGLSIGANLIFVFAVAGALAAATLWILPRWKPSLWVKLWMPCVMTALALWWLPFRNYESDRFYVGTNAVVDAIQSMEVVLFSHNPDRGDPFGNWYTLEFFRLGVVPFAICALIAALFAKPSRPLQFLILTFAGTCAFLWIAHTFFHVKYPAERTGLAVIFLFFVSWMAAMAHLWRNQLSRTIFAAPSLVLAFILLAQFAGQFDPRYFGTWRFDWKMTDLMANLKGKRGGTIRSYWLHRHAAEFYRDMYHLDFPLIPPESTDKLELKGATYYIVSSPDEAEIRAAGLRILYRDPMSGVTLLGPPPPLEL